MMCFVDNESKERRQVVDCAGCSALPSLSLRLPRGPVNETLASPSL